MPRMQAHTAAASSLPAAHLRPSGPSLYSLSGTLSFRLLVKSCGGGWEGTGELCVCVRVCVPLAGDWWVRDTGRGAARGTTGMEGPMKVARKKSGPSLSKARLCTAPQSLAACALPAARSSGRAVRSRARPPCIITTVPATSHTVLRSLPS